ncbi:hypothetical protein JOF53_000210 [Crossiella equi]|uniref:DinB-like domain-containing protein n=1 Tax=Crossiella equi TaxID=130796 RepID=A0ABS5A437_9PSEU|nr:DinB family protein [Crossiella equi]MBP2471338.1 hypothetical protein [Crossiella equi]
MTSPRVDLVLRQLDIAWALFEHHQTGLDDGIALWEPGPVVWTVRPDEAGRWHADWQVPEPEPVPLTTIAWVSWHIGFWWTTTLGHCFEGGAPEREDIHWPGTTERALAWLADLRARWSAGLRSLSEAELDSTERTATLPWGPGLTMADVAGWVVVELTKNVAEIGLLRHLHATTAGVEAAR